MGHSGDLAQKMGISIPIPTLGVNHQIRISVWEQRPIKNIWKIQYQFKVSPDSALHVGSGLVKYPIDSDNPNQESALDFMRTPDRKPFIPGSTLKGYTRSNFEVLVPGCCFITNKNSWEKPTACKDDSLKLCSACDLFGVNKIMGRVTFSDAYLISDYS